MNGLFSIHGRDRWRRSVFSRVVVLGRGLNHLDEDGWSLPGSASPPSDVPETQQSPSVNRPGFHGDCYLIAKVVNGRFVRSDDPPVNGPTNGYRHVRQACLHLAECWHWGTRPPDANEIHPCP